MSDLRGITLSARYCLEERIGAGGMSAVYRARDETLQRSVAVKVMNREVADDSDQLERFRREARAVAQLSHPNVVGVIDAREDAGHARRRGAPTTGGCSARPTTSPRSRRWGSP